MSGITEMNTLLSPALPQYYQYQQNLFQHGQRAVILAEHTVFQIKLELHCLPWLHSEMASTACQQRLQRWLELEDEHIEMPVDIQRHQDYLLMAYLHPEGKRLTDYLKQQDGRRLEISHFFNLAQALARALKTAHQAGCAHLALHPDYIYILDEEHQLRLHGFALFEKPELLLTSEGLSNFTPPEYLQPSPNWNPLWADIYMLGAVLYQMLAGVPPYADISSTELPDRIVSPEPPLAIKNFRPSIHPSLDALILRMLARQPQERIDSMETLLTQLDMIQNMAEVENPLSGIEALAAPSTPDTRQRHLGIPEHALLPRQFIWQKLQQDRTWFQYLCRSLQFSLCELCVNEIRQKIKYPDTSEKRFSHVYLVDNHLYLLIYQGLFIGALDIVSGKIHDEALSLLPQEPEKVCIANVSPQQAPLLLLLSNLLNPERKVSSPVLNSEHTNLFTEFSKLEQSHFNGYLILQRFLTVESTRPEVIVMGYSEGKNCFSLKLDWQNGFQPEPLAPQEFLSRGQIFVEVVPAILSPLESVLQALLSNAELQVSYENNYKNIPAEVTMIRPEELDIRTSESIKNNLSFEFKTETPLNLLWNQEVVDLRNFLRQKPHYILAHWLMTDFLFLLHESHSFKQMQPLYQALPQLQSFILETCAPDTFSCTHPFSLIGLNAERQPLLVAEIGKGTPEALQSFIQALKTSKKQQNKLLVAGLYVANTEIMPATQALYQKHIKEGGVIKKVKAYLKVSLTEGLFLILVQQKGQDFEVVCPSMWDHLN